MADTKQDKAGQQEYPGNRSPVNSSADQPEVQQESLKVHGDKLEQGGKHTTVAKDEPQAPQGL